MSRFGPELSIIVRKPLVPISDGITNLVTLPSFDNGSLTGWTIDDNDDSATITADVNVKRSGTHSMKSVTNFVSPDLTFASAYQDIAVEANSGYHLTFWSLTEEEFASMGGQFAVYDNSNADWIITRERAWGVSDSTWTKTSRFFRTPHGCTSIRLYLYQNIDSKNGEGSAVWYDDASLVKRLFAPSSTILTLPSSLQFSGYTHSITSDGFYDSASITFPATIEDMEDWLGNGLFRFIDVVDGEGEPIWSGFIDEVSIHYGPTSVSVGPILDAVNRGRLKYRTIDFATTPPVQGEDMKSVWVNDTYSQSRFGVLEGIMSGGEDTVDNMTQALGVLIEHKAWPNVSNNLGFGGGDVQVSLGCKGRVHLLKKYYYYNTGEAGLYNLSSKIADILTADPNMLTDVNNSKIESNTTQVGRYEGEDRTAKQILDELVDLGDSNYNRYLYGFDRNGLFFYQKEPVLVEYYRDVETGEIRNQAGDYVPPHRVLPGKWLRQTGRAVWKEIGGLPKHRNPSDIFIESVSYTAPNNLTITESSTSSVLRRLEEMGIA